MVMTTSQPAASAVGDAAVVAPRAINAASRSGERLRAQTGKPAASKLPAIGSPMMPRRINPIEGCALIPFFLLHCVRLHRTFLFENRPPHRHAPYSLLDPADDDTGDRVTFVNDDNEAHATTTADDKSFDSEGQVAARLHQARHHQLLLRTAPAHEGDDCRPACGERREAIRARHEAQLLPSASAPFSRVLHARDGAWFYVVISSAACDCRVVLRGCRRVRSGETRSPREQRDPFCP